MYICIVIPVDKVYKTVNELLSKNNGLTIKPEQFNSYAEIASNALQDDYRGANTAKKVSYGRDRTLDSRLNTHRVSNLLIPLNLLGEGNLPLDWVQTLSLRTVDYKPIRPLDEDRVAAAYQSYYAKPSPDNMFYEDLYERGDTYEGPIIKVHPAGEASAVLNYLRRPIKAVYAYTTVNRRAVFDLASSVNFDWDESQFGELVFRITQLCGVSLDKGQLIQYTQAKMNEE